MCANSSFLLIFLLLFFLISASNPGGIYKIDSNTGLVTVQGIIDRETAGSSFYLTVQVMFNFSANTFDVIV